MANKKEKVKIKHVCHICKQEISGDFEYIKTRRKTEMYFHPKCIRRKERSHGNCK